MVITGSLNLDSAEIDLDQQRDVGGHAREGQSLKTEREHRGRSSDTILCPVVLGVGHKIHNRLIILFDQSIIDYNRLLHL